MSLLKQPLFHFLVLGLLLFLVFEWVSPELPDEGRTIIVDREKLLTHMQLRAKTYDAARFGLVLDGMPADQLKTLIDSYVQEESLFRESLALGLDANDYTIRRRLLQKMEYITSNSTDPLSQVDLQAYYDNNKDRYFVAPTMTFTHVFVSSENHESEAAASEAASILLRELVDSEVDFSGAMLFGDRFAFHKNYVDKTEDFIASHFGREFAANVSQADADVWFGPVSSAFGYHLVLISERDEGRTPTLEEIIQDVTYDAQQAASREHSQKAIKGIVQTYEVVVDL